MAKAVTAGVGVTVAGVIVCVAVATMNDAGTVVAGGWYTGRGGGAEGDGSHMGPMWVGGRVAMPMLGGPRAGGVVRFGT